MCFVDSLFKFVQENKTYLNSSQTSFLQWTNLTKEKIQQLS